MANEQTVIVACEVFSPNLGDGVIAETTKFLVKSISPDYKVHFLDISGRGEAALSVSVPHKGKLPRPSSVWSNLIRGLLMYYRYHKNWNTTIKNADCIIVGGGQLLMDNALSFPLKINQVTTIAENYKVPLHIFATGVGAQWSPVGAHLFRQATNRANTISVRDTLSHQHLCQHLSHTRIDLSADPAIFAGSLYTQLDSHAQSSTIGLGIMTVDQINRYATDTKLRKEQLIQLWIDLAIQLQKWNVAFELFTNGDPKDQEFAQQIADIITQTTSITCLVALRPVRPNQLVQTIQKYQAIVASRLHAHIIATSCRIPSVALVWDKKVHSFFKDTNRSEFALDIFTTNAEQIINCLKHVRDIGIDYSVVEEKRNLVRSNLHQILN